MSKNIVVLSDGTGQDGGSEKNTNVYKAFNMLESRTPRQVVFYDPGVGTEGSLRRGMGQATGRGFGRNVKDCYRFIFDHYEVGDRLYLIGFSRGAATVRSLSAFIHLFGILPHSRARLIDQAWRIYRINDPAKRRERAKRFLGHHHTMWATIDVLACYDTVAALGLPFNWASQMLDRIPWLKHRFHDLRLSPAVKHAYHALALDDQRRTFHPLLWDPLEAEVEGVATDERLRCVEMKQVWFLGMHSDVGGGYEEQALSDIPLVWLMGNAVRHGLLVYPKHTVPIAEDPDGFMHDSRAGSWQRLFRKAARSWDDARADAPVLHESVLKRTKSVRNDTSERYLPWLSEHPNVELEPWDRFTPDRGFGAGAEAESRVGAEAGAGTVAAAGVEGEAAGSGSRSIDPASGAPAGPG